MYSIVWDDHQVNIDNQSDRSYWYINKLVLKKKMYLKVNSKSTWANTHDSMLELHSDVLDFRNKSKYVHINISCKFSMILLHVHDLYW